MNHRHISSYIIILLLGLPLHMAAQVGEHRNTLSLGVNGGYALNSIRFTPKVVQSMHGGVSAGLSMRYTVEKYFSTIASIAAEVNYTQLGWTEDIRDLERRPVINAVTGQPERYSRTISYLQIPLLAHLAWGREHRGVNFFVNAGPQLGIGLGESTSTNFAAADRNLTDRANKVVAQDSMQVQNKLDYGIAAGLGLEYCHPRAGRFLVEARYYYGLGNIYGDSKRDYFGSSNHGTITLKLTYLIDVMK